MAVSDWWDEMEPSCFFDIHSFLLTLYLHLFLEAAASDQDHIWRISRIEFLIVVRLTFVVTVRDRIFFSRTTCSRALSSTRTVLNHFTIRQGPSFDPVQ